MKRLAIFDIDGSLADDSGRITLGHNIYWTESNLKQIPAYVGILSKAKQVPQDELVILTGRGDNFRSVTENWLREKLGYNPVLVMRPNSMDYHLTPEFKLAEILRLIKLWKNPDRIYLYDDDPKTLAHIKQALTHDHRKELSNLVINKCFRGRLTTLVF